MPLNWEATGKVTNEFLNTVFNDCPRYEIMENGIKGRMIGGYNGFFLYGGRGLGKTSDIIKCFEMLGNYQAQNNGLREQHIGVLRNSNSNFMNTVGKSFSYWYDMMKSRSGLHGYFITDARTQPKVILRYPRMSFDQDDDGKLVTHYDGTTCEIVYFCYAVDKAGDEDKLKGGEFTSMWANEVNTMPQEAFEMMTAGVDRFPPYGASYPIWVADANPNHVNAWDYKYFIQKNPFNVKVIKYPSPILPTPDPLGEYVYHDKTVSWYPNPEATIHREDYSYWYNMLSNSDDFITNNVLGEYVQVRKGRSVHGDFDPERHVAKNALRPESHFQLYIPTDFGVKCGCLVAAINDEGGIEIYQDFVNDTGFIGLFNSLKRELIENFHEFYSGRRGTFIGDPRTGNKQDLMKGTRSRVVITDEGWGYAVPRDADTGKIVDNRVHRNESVSECLKRENGILIDPNCTTLIDALSFGAIAGDDNLMDKKKSGKYAELIDCLEYLCSYIALGGIEDEDDYGGNIIHAY